MEEVDQGDLGGPVSVKRTCHGTVASFLLYFQLKGATPFCAISRTLLSLFWLANQKYYQL